MTNDPTYTRLRELSWRRKLTEAEEAEMRVWLEAHPDARAEWEAEAGLNAALSRLPEAPVASNFTARVLRAVEHEDAAKPVSPRWRKWLRLRWLPRAAFAGSVASAALVSYLLIQNAERRKLADSVAAVADVESLPSPDILENFDAIRALNPTPIPDEQLLADLK